MTTSFASLRPLLLCALLAFVFATPVRAQQADSKEENWETVSIDGHIVQQMVTPEGDTILIAKLDDISITSPRSFANRDEYLLYMKYRYYATKVYPYARDAIHIFKEVERATREMKKKKRKKYIKKLQKDLKREFEEPLKNLTKTQGMILIKMIERELDTPLYELIKNLRGSMTASYWNTFSKFYGYNLKEGYIEGKDPMLDAVLQDFELWYDFDAEDDDESFTPQ